MIKERTPDLMELRRLARSAMEDVSTPEHERDLVITAQDLNWLLDHVESPLKRAIRTARGADGPPDEPVSLAREPKVNLNCPTCDVLYTGRGGQDGCAPVLSCPNGHQWPDPRGGKLPDTYP